VRAFRHGMCGTVRLFWLRCRTFRAQAHWCYQNIGALDGGTDECARRTSDRRIGRSWARHQPIHSYLLQLSLAVEQSLGDHYVLNQRTDTCTSTGRPRAWRHLRHQRGQARPLHQDPSQQSSVFACVAVENRGPPGGRTQGWRGDRKHRSDV
jgi:hypothetical protein